MKLITYNVGLLDVWIFGKKIFEFAPYTRARANAIPAELSQLDCDILFLQELYHESDALKFKEALKNNLPYSFFSNFQRNICLGHGLAIFSRYPLVDGVDIRFKSQLIDERIAGPKGFLCITIQHPTLGKILLINTHTTAGGLFLHPESSKSDSCRLIQLQQITNYINSSQYSIIAGDLNCSNEVSKENFDFILKNGYFYPQAIKETNDFGPTWDPKNSLNINGPHRTSPPQRIDHILFSKSLFDKLSFISVERVFCESTYIEKKYHTLSDHYGVCVHTL